MPATGLFVFSIFVGILMLVVIGAAWFVAIPVAFLLFLVPMAFLAALAARRDRGAKPTGAGGMPSTAEAAYDPVADPSQRPTTR